jgi:signal transduction histidine kinase/ActR/RegA family two-component response regulator
VAAFLLWSPAVIDIDPAGAAMVAPPPETPGSPGAPGRAVLVWGTTLPGQADPPPATLTEEGELPADLAGATEVVIVADWTRLAGDPAVIAGWRHRLAPVPVAVLVAVPRARLAEAWHHFDPDDVDDVLEVPAPPEAVALRIRTALRRQAERQGLDARAADFAEFQRVALALAAEADLNQLLELIVTKCRQVTCADAGSLYLVEPEEERRVLRFVVAQNDSRAVDLARVRLPLDRRSIAGYVALTRTPLNLPDVHRLPAGAEFAFNPEADHASGYRTISMLAIPLIGAADEVVGVLQVINRKRAAHVRLGTPEAARAEVQPFGPRDQELVGSLARLAAVVALKGRLAEDARRELEGQLLQAQKMEAIGQLAGGVAHDFNNLLFVINGRCDLLLRRLAVDDPLHRHVDLIRQTGERAATLTQKLLAFGRKQLLRPELLDLNAVVSGMEPMLRRLIGEHVELELRLAPDLAQTEADPGQVEQVILNLAVNARDAMPAGGRLTLETVNVELDEAFVRRNAGARAGAHAALIARDTGTGMTPEVLARVFEPFFTTKGPGKGSGLGLATVYGIVKQHRGYVVAESEPGRGAALTVYWPCVPSAVAAPAAPAAAAAPARGGRETILLVEDEAAVRQLLREILESSGYRVLEAPHGPDALAVAEQQPDRIDLLLTDVVMPHMSGRALADRLTAARPGLRVLYMSGYNDDAILHHGVRESGWVLLSKPFSSDVVTRTVRAVLDGAPAA